MRRSALNATLRVARIARAFNCDAPPWGRATDTVGTSIGVNGGCRVTHHTTTAATATAISRITVMIIRARVDRGTGWRLPRPELTLSWHTSRRQRPDRDLLSTSEGVPDQ
jgi:hypothetical protein